MASITTQERTDILKLVAGMFNAAPGSVYLNEFTEAYIALGKDLGALAAALGQTAPFQGLYPSYLTAEEFADKFLATLGLQENEEAQEWVQAQKNAGADNASIVFQALVALDASTSADFAAAKAQLANKAAVAEYYSVTLGKSADSLAALQGTLTGVTSDATTVDAAKAAIDGGSGGATGSFKLTAGQDDVFGTAGNDLFKANVVQNALGQQVNSLGSGDEIDGGAGFDTLNAKITSGVFAGGSESMPIQPEIKNVELINLQAVIADINASSNNDQVYFNAKDVVGVKKIASNYSDADLIVQNLTSKGNNHVSEMTVGMEYTGNADSRWAESDLSVYFDQDYLTTQRLVSRPSVDIQVMNEDAYDATNGARPLDGVFFRELTFTLNGTEYDLTAYLGEDVNGAGKEIETYDQALAAIKAALVELKAANPADAALQTVEADFGPIFTADRNPNTLQLREGQSIRLSVEGMTNGVDNSLQIAQTDLELARAKEATVANNNRFERADNEPPVEDSILSIKVDLEKVGLAGDGGELIIGSMNKTSANAWDAVNTTTDTVSGIQEFQVSVNGTNDKSSSLSGLHSTNNNLQNVIVTSAGGNDDRGGWANLTIGNSNTAGLLPAEFVELFGGTVGGNAQALKDVRVFDASQFKGDLTLNAALTAEVTAKYLNLVDQAPDAAAADNVSFEYTGGVGNDTFNLALSATNFFGAGTTREDWSLTVDGGKGDDTIILHIDANGLSGTNVAPWYLNQSLKQEEKGWAQIAVLGGEGNDTVRTIGSGDYAIDLGAGNDTAYLDNTGVRARWVLNADNAVPTVSDENDSYQLFGTKVQVSFKGFEVSVDLQDVNGTATDLAINQAVKQAINSDPVLSKLLQATDGPGNTLVVDALIDGNNADALNITLVPPTTVTAGDLQTLNAAYGTNLDAAGMVARLAAEAAKFNLNTDGTYNQDSVLAGADSTLHVQDSRVEGGLGNDVIVLGTGAFSNDTVVYKGFGNGTDTIVNFDTTWNAAETIGYETLPPVAEQITVKFAAGSGTAAQTIIFDGVTVNLSNPATQGVIPAADVAFQFAAAYEAAGGNWTVLGWDAATATVLLEAVTPGDVTDVVAGDFGGTYTGATVTTTVQGDVGSIPGTESTFTVAFDAATTAANAAGSFTFDGVTVAYAQGDGAVTLAQKLAAASYPNWDVQLVGNPAVGTNGTYSVIFEAKAPGATAIPADLAAITTGGTATPGIAATVGGTLGTANIGTLVPVVTPAGPGNGFDYIDFSAYDAVNVQVGANTFGAAAAQGEKYITMVEDANTGKYVVTVYEEGGAAADVELGVVGTLDFGATQAFVAENFIL